jgi:hypothetical protein
MIKGIHLTLEVKTSFDNSTSATDFSTESSTYKARLPVIAGIDIVRKKRGICTQKVIKQSLSDYAQ